MLRKKIICVLILTLIIYCSIMPFYTAKSNAEVSVEPIPKISSEWVSVYSVDSNKQLLSFNSNEKYYPASLTKLMTAIVAIENADVSADYMPKTSETVTVGKEILTLAEGYKSAGFMEGDIVALPDLITAMIVNNADDAAIIIGAYIGRKDLGGVADPRYNYDKLAIEHFVDMMNYRSSLMGLTLTTFSNCTGIDGETDMHSTPADMARISSLFLSYKFLKNISSQYEVKYWDITEPPEEIPEEPEETPEGDSENSDDMTEEPEEKDPVEEARNSLWTSSNQLINPDSEYYYEYCSGLIACRTAENGVFVSAYAEYNDIKVVIVAMEADIETVYDDIIKLFNYVFNNYVMHTFVEDGQIIAQYYVKNAMDPSNEHLYVCAKSGGKHLSRIDDLSKFGYEIRLNDKYFAPTEQNLYDTYISPSGGIVKGDVLGTMDIYYDTVYIDTVIIYAGNTVPVFENMPQATTSKWYSEIDWASIFLTVFVIFLIISIFVLIISITNKLKKQKRVKQRYSPRRVPKKPAAYYNKKRN